MLSLSAELSKETVNLQVVNGQGSGGVEYGAELAQFAQAIAGGDEAALKEARSNLLTCAGIQVLIDAAAVAANFQRMVRIADGTGIPVDGVMMSLGGSIQDDLNLRRFESARNTPAQSRLKRWSGIFARKLAPTLLGRMAKKS